MRPSLVLLQEKLELFFLMIVGLLSDRGREWEGREVTDRTRITISARQPKHTHLVGRLEGNITGPDSFVRVLHRVPEKEAKGGPKGEKDENLDDGVAEGGSVVLAGKDGEDGCVLGDGVGSQNESIKTGFAIFAR